MIERLDSLLTRLRDQEEKRHDPEHNLPHIHDYANGPEIHGAAGTVETSELRDEVARLADIVRDLALRDIRK